MRKKQGSGEAFPGLGFAKKLLSLLAMASFLCVSLPGVPAMEVKAAAQGVNVAYRTKEEIAEYLVTSGATTETTATYKYAAHTYPALWGRSL